MTGPNLDLTEEQRMIRDAAPQLLADRHDILDREAEFFGDHFGRRRRAEPLDAHDLALIAHVFLPALRHTGFDRNARFELRRQHALAVFARLNVEQFPTRQADYARVNALLCQFFIRADGQLDF